MISPTDSFFHVGSSQWFSREKLQRLILPALLVLGIAASQGAHGQSSAARSSPQFEVASVKFHKPGSSPVGDLPGSNCPLNASDACDQTGGLFSATNYRLDVYIAFAYKVLPSQTESILEQLPKWALTDHFDIQARANADATKDQMRMMMRSLLADRFKLAAHTETKQTSVYAVELERPAKIGPNLQPHAATSIPCEAAASASQPPIFSSALPGLPAACGVLQTKFEAGHLRVGARNVSIDFIESYFPSRTMGNFDRPTIDKTSLSGNFDFTLEWTPDELNLNGAKAALDPNGPTFYEALKDQLGLKLVPATGTVSNLIIDHIEEPSPN